MTWACLCGYPIQNLQPCRKHYLPLTGSENFFFETLRHHHFIPLPPSKTRAWRAPWDVVWASYSSSCWACSSGWWLGNIPALYLMATTACARKHEGVARRTRGGYQASLQTSRTGSEQGGDVAATTRYLALWRQRGAGRRATSIYACGHNSRNAYSRFSRM